MSILRYEQPRPPAAGAGEPAVEVLFGRLVTLLGALPLLWVAWLVGALSISSDRLAAELLWGLVLLPAAAVLLLTGWVTWPLLRRCLRELSGGTLLLLLGNLAAEAAIGAFGQVVWAALTAPPAAYY